ncbi:MAG: hypothetical protein J6M92_12850 [Oribacterium sp.]|nr:hypothetical protein [Oribacterium sp.]
MDYEKFKQDMEQDVLKNLANRGIEAETDVQPEDILTDSVYHYDSKDKVFELAEKFEERIAAKQRESARRNHYKNTNFPGAQENQPIRRDGVSRHSDIGWSHPYFVPCRSAASGGRD